jgi:uncharacterized protein
MRELRIVDADTHVDENEETWSHLSEAQRWFTPESCTVTETNKQWRFLDGYTRSRRTRDDQRTNTTLASRELIDVNVRLRHMDELGVDVHVIYPTVLLTACTLRPDVEAGLCRAYNSWLAEKCRQSGGRLRWVAVLPVLELSAALDEIAFAKDHGAAGVMKKGFDHEYRVAGDPYFYPLYEKASELDIAVCIHAGTGDPTQTFLVSKPFGGMWPQVLPVIAACSSLLDAQVPVLFPKLRTGFIEAGSSWIPAVLDMFWAGNDRQAVAVLDRASLPEKQMRDVFRDSRFFVTYQTHEDLPYLLELGLEDSLVIGTDYCHADQSADMNMLRTMQQRAERGDISATAVRKMLDDNPRRLYGLES